MDSALLLGTLASQPHEQAVVAAVTAAEALDGRSGGDGETVLVTVCELLTHEMSLFFQR